MAKRESTDGCPCRLHDGSECRRLAAAGLAVLCEVDVLDDVGAGQGEDVCARVPGLTEKRLDKILALVDKDGPGGCWLWGGCLGGYTVPRVMIAGRYESVARLMWAVAEGEELVKGEVLVRTCGEVRCVNPAHMAVRKQGTRWVDLGAR